MSVEPVWARPAPAKPAPAARSLTQRLAVPLIALLFFSALAVLLFINTWVRPFSYSIGSAGDPPQFMWFLAWSPFALSHALNPFFSGYVDAPSGFNLLWNCTLPLLSAVLAPITATLGSVFSFNVLETLGVALSAFTGFLFIRRYVPQPLAAGAGALVYGFSPGMMAQTLGHPHVSVLFLPPLILLTVDEIVRLQRFPPLVLGALLGVMGAAQMLIGEEMLAVTALIVAIALAVAAAMAPSLIRPNLRYAVRAIVASGIAFVVLAGGPLAFQFFGPQRLHGLVHGPNEFVSDLFSFFVPTQMSLLAPKAAVHFTEHFTGNVSEWNSYIGIPMALLLAFIAWRFWDRFLVRLTTFVGVVIAILSLGVTIHYHGHVSTMPVFVLALAFPLIARLVPRGTMPGLTLLYATFLAWLAMYKAPIFDDVLPARLMMIGYLFIGLLLAVFLEWVFTLRARGRVVAGLAAAGLAMIPMIPVIPYWSTPAPIPAFFTSTALQRIPLNSVALVLPYSNAEESRPMLWQAASNMRFKMPEGYVYITTGIEPPPSTTQTTAVAIVNGQASTETVDASQQDGLRADLKAWKVQTVIIGPMAFEQQAVDIYTAVLGRPPEQVGGVYVWYGVNGG